MSRGYTPLTVLIWTATVGCLRARRFGVDAPKDHDFLFRHYVTWYRSGVHETFRGVKVSM